ncbi:MAG: HEAT repeat domain-containing protein [Agriterribacter sp.]
MRKFSLSALIAFFFVACFVSCTSSDKKTENTQEPVKDKFADHIRTTEFQTPEKEKAGFTLPEGFEVTLFAAEPDITKPINMEFDDRGRLWVTQSQEYPMPAGKGEGKDRITILEDTNGDGKADVFTHFSDSCNIPIGIMPVADGAIAYSIPDISHFIDSNNDGKADKKEKMIGSFGYRDTHGMVNNFISGYDGWIHSCHGFTNNSTVAGKDGDSITMVSGNTFRFRKDGSHVEQTTFGRINPFGYAYDERGYLYSVDCHSKPIFQLIRGGEYLVWGKKEPGIGYAPEMMSYELGSTALAGLVYYTAEQFPEEYRKGFYTGDVVTCRIDRNTTTYKGSTPVAKKEKPFLLSDDPWFRPVDIKVGPDGAMYVADFYNRIIGHYEVALDNPLRDRTSGRIWKITYTGKADHKVTPVKDWSKATLQELVDGLNNPIFNQRTKIADRLVDVWQQKAVEPVTKMVTANKAGDAAYIHGLWILQRLNALPEALLDAALQHSNPIAKQHAFRILSERKQLEPKYAAIVLTALNDKDPFIQRTAAEVLNRFPAASNIKPLLELYNKTDTSDSHLRYTALLAVRNNLRIKNILPPTLGASWNEADMKVLTRALLDVPSAEGAAFVLQYINTHDVSAETLKADIAYISQYGSAKLISQIIPLITKKFNNDYQEQLLLYPVIKAGIEKGGMQLSPEFKNWAMGLAPRFLGDITETADTWKSVALGEIENDDYAWERSDKFLPDVMPAFRIYLSENHGYVPKSILYTKPFKLPAALSMNIFDNDVHNREEKKGISKNEVRIRLADSKAVIAAYKVNMEKAMEFKDLIKNKSFDLKQWEGQLGYIEVIDSSETGSIGIGKLEPAVVDMPDATPSDKNELRKKAIEIAGDYKIASLEPQLLTVLKAKWMPANARADAANALVQIAPQKYTSLLGTIFQDKTERSIVREKLASTLGQINNTASLNALNAGLPGSARNVQIAAATTLAGSSAGIDILINAVKKEELNADILAEVRVNERLLANSKPAQKKIVDEMTAGGAKEREERQKLIDARIVGFHSTGKLAEAGKAVFTTNCAICHRIKGNGGMIGPQLDAIGNWGLKALSTKVLDPNRNISEAFRTYMITMKDGKQMTGLLRRQEGEVIVFADNTGKEFSLPKKDIKEYKPSKYTLMPDQFRNVIPEKDFYALMEYLLSVK